MRRISRSSFAGFTLLEILLALAIAVTLVVVTVPAFGGWMEERAIRLELEEFAEVVMLARREAERTGGNAFVWIEGSENVPSEFGTHVGHYRIGKGFDLQRKGTSQDWLPAEDSLLRIEPGGILSPLPFRLFRGERYILFRFDPLTGHLEEQEFSF